MDKKVVKFLFDKVKIKMDDKFSEFVEYESELFKIKETETAYEPYQLVDNNWEQADESLTVTFLSFGIPADNPFIAHA